MLRLVALVAALSASALAASISWTGYAGDNQWNNHNNWYPNSVPGVNDDVTIPYGTVQVTTPVAVNSLLMGTQVAQSANLTLFADFSVVNGLQVAANGNVIVDSAAAQVSATATFVGGSLLVQVGGLSGQWSLTKGTQFQLQTGSLSGQWSLDSTTQTVFSGSAAKALIGAGFTTQGSLSLSGLLVLNQSSVLNANAATQIVGGLFIQNQDSTACLFSSVSGTGVTVNGGLTVMATANFGAVTLQSGNVSLFGAVTFTQPLTIPAGISVTTLGTAAVNLTNGVSGAGILTSSGSTLVVGDLSMTGYVNLMGGSTVFSSKSKIGVLTLGGGTSMFSAMVKTMQLNFLGGIVEGKHSIVATNAWASTKGINLKAPIEVSGTLTVGASLFNFGQAGSLTLHRNSTTNVIGAWQVTGNMASTGITNQGTVNANSPISVQNINIGGTGSVVVSGTVTIGTNTFVQSSVTLSAGAVFSGSNSQLTIQVVSAPSTVTAVIGKYSFTCKHQCDKVQTSGQPSSPFSLSGH